MFPDALVAECKKCRDQVSPESWKKISKVLEQELGADLQQIHDLDQTPIASASIAQVHFANINIDGK